MTALTPRQSVPELAIDTLSGTWIVRDRNPERFSMIVVYRGLHCPICKSSLRDLDRKFDDFANRGVEVLALSVDTEERARLAKEEWGIENVPIGYGLSENDARSWGLYVSTGISEKEPPIFFEPGLFLIKPDATLYAASIQSMPFARPAFDDLLSAVDFIVENDYPARGEA